MFVVVVLADIIHPTEPALLTTNEPFYGRAVERHWAAADCWQTGEIRTIAIPITFYKLCRRRLRHAADSDFRNPNFFYSLTILSSWHDRLNVGFVCY